MVARETPEEKKVIEGFVEGHNANQVVQGEQKVDLNPVLDQLEDIVERVILPDIPEQKNPEFDYGLQVVNNVFTVNSVGDMTIHVPPLQPPQGENAQQLMLSGAW